MADDTVQTIKEGFEILCMLSRNIAMLPLEDWDKAFERAESVAGIIDPTLFREYLYSDKAKVIREIIRAAIPIKAAVLKAQPIARKELGIDA